MPAGVTGICSFNKGSQTHPLEGFVFTLAFASIPLKTVIYSGELIHMF